MQELKQFKKDKKIIKFKPPKIKPEFNISTIVFLIVFFYLIFGIIVFFTTEHVALYEVREGTLLKNSYYNGIAIREESVVVSENTGYINFFVDEGSKVAKTQNIYTLSNTKLDLTSEAASSEESVEISEKDQQEILELITGFTSNNADAQVNDMAHLKSSINSTLQKKENQTQNILLDSIVAQSQGAVSALQSPEDGIIVFSVDGYESLTKESVTNEVFDKGQYHSDNTKGGEAIETSEPLYKIITSETWSIAISLTEEEVENYKDMKTVNVTFSMDDATIPADFALQGNIGILTFYEGMVRYATERYLDIELNISDREGLKVPNSSLIDFDTYVIPKSYIVLDGEGDYMLVQDEEGISQPVTVDIKYSDDTNYYISMEGVNEKMLIKLIEQSVDEAIETVNAPQLSDIFVLSEKRTFTGVYNVDDGYTKIMYVNIISSNDEYSIIEDSGMYSLRNYDHIVLKSDGVKEFEII